jgi:hypothetical protein
MIRKHRLWSVALLGVAAVSGCAGTTPVRQHPEFAEATRRIETIAILPPEVEHQLVTFSGDNERLPERERSITRELNTLVRMLLEGKHYQVRPIEDEWPGDAKKDESVELRQLRTASNEALRQLYGPEAGPDSSSATRASVGAAASPVAEQLQADALLLVRYAGFEKSKGQRVKDFTTSVLFGTLIGVASGGMVIPMSTSGRSGGAVQLALIDGTSGDLLWANQVAGSTDSRSSGPAWSRRTRGGLGSLVHGAMLALPDKGLATSERGTETAAPATAAATAP